MDPRQHIVTRWLFLRLLAAVHVVAFASYWAQVHGLIGEAGIHPAAAKLERVAAWLAQQDQSRWWNAPTLGWLFGAGDGALHLLCASGVVLAVVLAAGFAPRLALAGLWALYLSLFTLSDPFMGYQWDILLLEVTFVAILYAGGAGAGVRTITFRFSGGKAKCDRSDPGPGRTPPSRVALWLLRFVLFKVMFLSGVVKLNSGDPAWRDLTAMTYHYWTQPLPHGMSWFAHSLPLWMHKLSVVGMLFTELVVAWLVFFNPRGWRLAAWLGLSLVAVLWNELQVTLGLAAFLVIAAALLDDRVWRRLRGIEEPAPTRRMAAFWAFVGLMGGIAATGNYGFFQVLVLALCVTLLDDEIIRRWTPARWRDRWPAPTERAPGWRQAALVWPVAAGLLLLSALNMLSLVGRKTLDEAVDARELGDAGAGQILLAGLVDLRGAVLPKVRQFALANRYGLFATMTKTRDELIVEGTADGYTWLPYRFRYKPDSPFDAPTFAGVHMPRLDWQLWFAALTPRCHPESGNRWSLAFVRRLLEGSEPVLGLLAHNPFPDAPPRAVRIRAAAYTFSGEPGRVWDVEEKPAPWCPPLTLQSFRGG